MRFKKLTAGIVAASLALSTLAQSAIAGSITFSDDQWWTQMSIDRDDLLEGYFPVDISSITFYSQTDYMLGYYSTSDGKWKEKSYIANTRNEISDIQLYDSQEHPYAFNVMLSKGDGIDYTINWDVNPIVYAIPFTPNTQMFDGGKLRANIYNEWVVADGQNTEIIARDAFYGAKTISVEFTVDNYTEDFNAWLSIFAENLSYWSEDTDSNSGIEQVPVHINGNGKYVINLSTKKPMNIVSDYNFYCALQTDIEGSDDDTDVPVLTITSISKTGSVTGYSDPVYPGDSSGSIDEPYDPVYPGDSSGAVEEPDEPSKDESIDIICKSIDDLQSSHPYDNNINYSYTYTDENCKNLKITFSDDTKFEDNYDYLTIYDSEENMVGQFTGESLSGETVVVPGNKVKMVLTTDRSGTYYGFRVVSVENIDKMPEIGDPEYDYVLGKYVDPDNGNVSNYLKKYRGAGGNIVIPSVIDGKKISWIGGAAFSDCTSLTSVTIPDSVTGIEWGAFYNCTSLKSVTIPDSVTYIVSDAFFGCTALKSIDIPGSVTWIGDYAFGYCYGDDGNYTKVSDFKINYVKNSYGHYYAAKNGFTNEPCLFTKELEDGTLSIVGYADSAETFTIPSEIEGKKVTEIEDSAFAYSTSLTSVTIPDSVTYIGSQAFCGCESLTNINIPDSVTYIASKAFINCKSLKSVTIPASVAFIDNYAFGYIEDENWNYTKVDGFKINYDENTYGHYYATKNGFSNETCLVTETLYDGSIGIKAYAGNNKTFTVPAEINGKQVTEIGVRAFDGDTALTSIIISDGVTKINWQAFSGCTSLAGVKIPDSVTEISDEAFFNCKNLKSVTIPESVSYIGSYAFGYCYDENWNYAKVDGFEINYIKNTYGHYYATKNGFSDESEPCLLTSVQNDGTLCITGYVGNTDTFAIPSAIDGKRVTAIGDNSFESNIVLKNVTIPDSVTYIGSDAFNSCTSLESVKLPSNLETIESSSFANCTSLTSVTIPDSVTGIEWGAFDNCTSLKSVTIPDSVTYIIGDAFFGCKALKSVNIPGSVTSIGDYAFGYCYGDDGNYAKVSDFKINYVKNSYGHYYATKNGFSNEICLITKRTYGSYYIHRYAGNDKALTIPSEVDGKTITAIGENAFEGNTTLTSVIIPDGITSIGWWAFRNCTSLADVIISDSVTEISESAFENCTSLKSVTIPASVNNIGDYAFGYCRDSDSNYAKIDDFKINYTKNTYGHYYAYENGFTNEPCQVVIDQLYDGTLSIIRFVGNDKTYTIPSEIDGKKVTRIGDGAFKDNTTLTSVTIPDGVTNIGWHTFNNCTSLTDVTIPNSVTGIGGGAFINCTSLKFVTIPASVTWIGDYAFGYCYDSDWNYTKIDGFKINYTKNTYGHYYATINGFSNETCLITEDHVDGTLAIHRYAGVDETFTVPSQINGKKVTEIGNDAFVGNATLTGVTLPDGIKTIGWQAFNNCTKLNDINIPDSVTSIGSYAFVNTAIINNQTSSVKYIGNWVIGCDDSAEAVSIKSGTIGIADGSFMDCSYLMSITIPNSVKFIGGSAFRDCTSLKSVTIPDGVKVISERAFMNCDSLTDITMPGSVTEIGEYAFFDCNTLVSVEIPNGVIKIKFYAFAECNELKNVTIPDSVKHIGEYAFNGTAIVNDQSTPVKYIDKWVMYCDHDVSTASIKAGTVGIAGYSFGWCSSLTSVTIPDSVKYIGDGAFISCSSLKNVKIPSNVISIGIDAFLSCTSLEEITIPNSTTSIGNNAFANCTSLKSIVIPVSVKTIDGEAFGYYYDSNAKNYVKDNRFKIYCYAGTAGEQYAINNGFEYELLNCTEHNYGDWEITKAATCTESGTKVHICTVCGEEETIEIPATGHTEVVDKAVAATCTETGLTEGSHCSVCGKIIEEQAVIPAKGHQYTETVVAPTYTSTGYTLYKCSVCGYSYKDNETAKLTLSKVTNFKVKSISSTNVTLQWTKNSAASGYEIEQYKDGKWVNVAKITSNATTSYTVKGLAAGTAGYKFRMRAVKDGAYSDYTSTLTVNTNPYGVGGFKTKSISSTSITLQWNKGTTASGYELQQYKDGKWVTIYTGAKATDTSYTVKNLKAGTAGYRFRIRAYKTYGSTKQYGSWSSEVKVNTNPYGVSGFKCSSKSSTSVTLKWNKGTTASGYQLQQYKDGKWVTIYTADKATSTSYTVKGLKAGTAGYRFRIRAYKTYGSTKQYGSWSSEVKVNTNPYGVGGFKCSSKSSTSVTLKWNKGTTASGYQLQQYKNGKWVTIYTGTKATSTSYTVKNLKAGTAGYRFRIRAYKTYGSTKQYGSWSSEVKVNTNPYGVGGFKAKSTAKTSITLGWNKGTTASGYQLQQYKNGKWVTVYTGTKATSTSYTVKSLKANTSYKFRIRAYKTYGSTKQYGSWSSTLTVKTKK